MTVYIYYRSLCYRIWVKRSFYRFVKNCLAILYIRRTENCSLLPPTVRISSNFDLARIIKCKVSVISVFLSYSQYCEVVSKMRGESMVQSGCFNNVICIGGQFFPCRPSCPIVSSISHEHIAVIKLFKGLSPIIGACIPCFFNNYNSSCGNRKICHCLSISHKLNIVNSRRYYAIEVRVIREFACSIQQICVAILSILIW